MKFKLQERISQNLYYVSDVELVGGKPWVMSEGIHIATNINVCRELADAKGFTDPHYYEVKVRPDVLANALFLDYDLGVWSAGNIAEEIIKKTNKEKYTSGTDPNLYTDDSHSGDTIPTQRIHLKRALGDREVNRANVIKSYKGKTIKQDDGTRKADVSTARGWQYLKDLLNKLGYKCISYTNYVEDEKGSLCYLLFSADDIISCRPKNNINPLGESMILKEEKEYLDKDRDIRDYGTGRAEGTNVFTERTGISFYDNLFDKPDYMRDHKNLVGEIKYMTPLEYYKECAKIFSNDKHFVSIDDLKNQRSRDAKIIEELTDIVTKYKTRLYLPYLNYAEKEQEGLHRMLAVANIFGWAEEKFPVLIINWADEDLHNRQVRQQYEARCEWETEEAIKEAFRYYYPQDKCEEYLKEQIEWELPRKQCYMTDEDLKKALDTLEVKITNDKVIVSVDGKEYSYDRSEWLRIEDDDDLPDEDVLTDDNIDDLLDLDITDLLFKMKD